MVCQMIDSAASAPALQNPDGPASTGQSWTELPAASRGPNFALFGSSKIVSYNFLFPTALTSSGMCWTALEALGNFGSAV